MQEQLASSDPSGHSVSPSHHHEANIHLAPVAQRRVCGLHSTSKHKSTVQKYKEINQLFSKSA